jgi:hypothetical protein
MSLADIGSIMDLAKIESSKLEESFEQLKNTDIPSVVSRMKNNPDEVEKIIDEQMGSITPEMMEKARKLISEGQGQQILKEMMKKGVNPSELKNKILKQKKELKKANKTTIQKVSYQNVIHITNSRQAKVRKIQSDNIEVSVKAILNAPSAVELSCSRLSKGPFAKKTLKVWYNPEKPGKNKRSSKIMGFPVGSDLIILSVGDDIDLKSFELMETYLK